MRRWFHEPLLHFAIAGALLFGVQGWVGDDGEQPQVVRITAADVEWLAAIWTRQRQRPPDAGELRSLVAGYLREDLLAREARQLGLEENDTIVRRRLAQKMEFLLEDAALGVEPDEAALRKIYETGRARYRSRPQVSFRQVFFRAEDSAKSALATLVARPDAEAGEPTVLPADFSAVDEQAVASQLGPAFAALLFALPDGGWQGPVESTYGYHLVQITGREAGKALSFDAARAAVEEEWRQTQRDKARAEFNSKLLAEYEIIFDDSVAELLGPVEAALR